MAKKQKVSITALENLSWWFTQPTSKANQGVPDSKSRKDKSSKKRKI